MKFDVLLKLTPSGDWMNRTHCFCVGDKHQHPHFWAEVSQEVGSVAVP